MILKSGGKSNVQPRTRPPSLNAIAAGLFIVLYHFHIQLMAAAEEKRINREETDAQRARDAEKIQVYEASVYVHMWGACESALTIKWPESQRQARACKESHCRSFLSACFLREKRRFSLFLSLSLSLFTFFLSFFLFYSRYRGPSYKLPPSLSSIPRFLLCSP